MSDQTFLSGPQRSPAPQTMYQYLCTRDAETTAAIANQVRLICASVCLMFLLGTVALCLRPLCGSGWAPLEMTGLAASHYNVRSSSRHRQWPAARPAAASLKTSGNRPPNVSTSVSASSLQASPSNTIPGKPMSLPPPSCVHSATFYPATVGFSVAVLAVLLLLVSACRALRLQCRRAAVLQCLIRAARAGCAEVPRDKLTRLVDTADLSAVERVIQRSRRPGYGAV